MSSLSGSSSPDPLHLASSPLAAHPYTRRSVAPPITHSAQRATPSARASPSKSFLMNTGDAQIRVTVEPVERLGSHTPSKRRASSRTTTIPLRTGESSPARKRRQPTPAAHVDGDTSVLSRRSSKKRKGTPVAHVRESLAQSRRINDVVLDEHAIDDGDHGATFSEQSVPSSEVRRRRSLYPLRTQKYKRLSAAREDFNDALQDAIGTDAPAYSGGYYSDHGGELTTANEDFTMITGASLASIKANTTMMSTQEDIERSRVEHHLTSSPPRSEVAYPDIAIQAEDAKTPKPDSVVADGDYYAMSWKPTQPAPTMFEQRKPDSPRKDAEVFLDDEVTHSHEIVEDDEQSPQHGDSSPIAETSSHHASPEPDAPGKEQDATLGAQDPSGFSDPSMPPDPVSEAADDDIWAEEASRDIDDSIVSNHSRPPRTFNQSTNTLNESTNTLKQSTSTLDKSISNLDHSTSTTTSVPPVVSEQPDPPRRAKLPRTWRRKSRNDLSYADSLKQKAPVEQPKPEIERRASADEAGEESGRSSGVLTPPSTDDDDDSRRRNEDESSKMQETEGASFHRFEEEQQEGVEEEDEEALEEEPEEEEDQDISGLTNPNAADTQLEAHHRFSRQHKDDEEVEEDEEDEEEEDDEIASPLSDKSGTDASASPGGSGEDTGFFWQSNMPQVYRPERPKPPQRKKPIDLSAILRMDESNVDSAEAESKAEPEPEPLKPQSRRAAPITASRRIRHPVTRAQQHAESSPGHILPSPLRRSLLKTSRELETAESVPKQKPYQPSAVSRIEETQANVTDDSLASKASDQRQLIEEFRTNTPVARKPAPERLAVLRDDPQPSRPAEAETETSYEETEATQDPSWPDHSYEENLNIASPQKITVNFNDSTLSFRDQYQPAQQSNLLAPKGPIPALFSKSTNAPVLKPAYTNNGKAGLSPGSPTITLVSRQPTTTHQQQQENSTVFSRLSTSFWSAVASRQQGPPPTPAPAARTTEQAISLSLRAQLRSRYGVLSNAHPWTMAHMRTLHRLLNSLESGRRDSIVPTHTPLPKHLLSILGQQRKTATGDAFVFEQRHACVVQAFLQLLVAPSLVRSMENGEVEWLGDAQAAHLRGEMGGRVGSETCFKTLKPRSGLVTWEWVVECLGCCVISNAEMGLGHVERRVEVERDVEFSIMGDGEGDGRVREWFEREGEERRVFT